MHTNKVRCLRFFIARRYGIACKCCYRLFCCHSSFEKCQSFTDAVNLQRHRHWAAQTLVRSAITRSYIWGSNVLLYVDTDLRSMRERKHLEVTYDSLMPLYYGLYRMLEPHTTVSQSRGP